MSRIREHFLMRFRSKTVMIAVQVLSRDLSSFQLNNHHPRLSPIMLLTSNLIMEDNDKALAFNPNCIHGKTFHPITYNTSQSISYLLKHFTQNFLSILAVFVTVLMVNLGVCLYYLHFQTLQHQYLGLLRVLLTQISFLNAWDHLECLTI